MKFNSAVYAAREDTANARAAVSIKLDAAGNPVNSGHNGRPFTMSEVIAAQQAQSYAAYQGAMIFLDSIIGDDADTATRKAFDRAKVKFVSVGHAEEMRDKLITAALNGSNAALIAYAAANLFLNPYAAVDFGWFVNGSDDLKVVFDDQGYQAAQIAVSASRPFVGHESDYEGFAVSYRPTPTVPVTVARPTREKHAPAPAAPTVAPALPVPTPEKPAPVTITDGQDRVLVATSTGWKAESKSSPGTFHYISHDGTRCTCKGHTFRRKCWHTATVRTHHLAHA